MSRLQKALGRRIRALRERRDWTQEDLGKACRMDYKSLGAIERGESNVTISNVEKIAKGLRVKPYQLFLFGPTDEEKLSEEMILALVKQCDKARKQSLLRPDISPQSTQSTQRFL